MSEQEIEEGNVGVVIEEADEAQSPMYLSESAQREKTAKLLAGCLERIGKTSCGKNHAFVELRCEGKRLSELFTIFESYPHLRKVSLGSNKLTSVGSLCSSVKYLTHLDLSNNSISSLDAFAIPNTLEFLLDLNLAGNRITELVDINVKSLRKLNLGRNEIVTCERFTGHANIAVLILHKNKLTNASGIAHMPSLEEVYLAENPLTSFFDMNDLPNLKKIHARKTDIKQFGPSLKPIVVDQAEEDAAAAAEVAEGKEPVEKVQMAPEVFLPLPHLPLLNYLNLRETKLDDVKQMKIFITLTGLRQINALATEMSDTTEYAVKEELLMMMPHLKRINKEPIEAEEVTDALNKLKERLDEQERQRLEEEERKREEAERKREEEQKIKEEEEERIRQEMLEKKQAEEERIRQQQEEAEQATSRSRQDQLQQEGEAGEAGEQEEE